MLVTELYPERVKALPKAGRHILARFNDESVVYRPADPAVAGRLRLAADSVDGGER